MARLQGQGQGEYKFMGEAGLQIRRGETESLENKAETPEDGGGCL